MHVKGFHFFLLLMMQFIVTVLHARHPMGADLVYTCIDSNHHTYSVVLNFYCDCRELDEYPDIVLNVASVSCGQNFSVTPNWQPCPASTNGGQPCEITPLCFASVLQSECNGGSLQGMLDYTYTDTITLPALCSDWVISFDICCRSAFISNLINPDADDLYIQATINNTLAHNDHSPVFTGNPVPFICFSYPFTCNMGAVDADGDSLVYSVIEPMGAGALPVPYVPGYSNNNPVSSSGPFTLNTATGEINFIPVDIGVFVIAVQVSEYRRGALIGTTMRDIQIAVDNLPSCSQPPPLFSGIDSANVSGGVMTDSFEVQICPGGRLSFSALATEPSGDSVFMQSDITVAIPGAGFSVNRISKDSVMGNFTWSSPAGDTGKHIFIVTVTNNQCPVIVIQNYAITVDVITAAYTRSGNDTLICKGSGAQLTATGSTSYVWSPSSTLSCSYCPAPVATPDTTTTYWVLFRDSLSACMVTQRDTVKIQDLAVIPLFTDTLVGEGAHLVLGVTTTEIYGQPTYSWWPAEYLNNAVSPHPVAVPLTDILYTVKVTGDGCVDSAQINVRVKDSPNPMVMPNAFTPNGDGRNDYFYPVTFNNIGTVKTFRIYDRWGQLVHDATGPWDGKFKGEKQPPGTYIYYLDIQIPNQGDMHVEGAVTLLR